MSGLPWFKNDPMAFNDGMMGLTRSERGVYCTIINAIYAQGEPVHDSDAYWCAVFMCKPVAWRRDLEALVAAGKLYLTEYGGRPCIMNRRAAAEIDAYESLRGERAKAGKAGGVASGSSRRSKTKQNEASASEGEMEPVSFDNEAKRSKTKQIRREEIRGDIRGLPSEERTNLSEGTSSRPTTLKVVHPYDEPWDEAL